MNRRNRTTLPAAILLGRRSGSILLPIAGLVLATAFAAASLAKPAPDQPSVAGAESATSSTPPAKSPAVTDSPLRHSGFMRPPGTKAPTPPPPERPHRKASPYQPTVATQKATNFYAATWGIDKLHLNYTMSGNLIRFSFRVVDPKLAKALGDRDATPGLYLPRSRAMLQVPNMEQIGQLRQLHTEERNKEYWMVFSNKGNLVRKGDKVDVIIGKFHADGLVVE